MTDITRLLMIGDSSDIQRLLSHLPDDRFSLQLCQPDAPLQPQLADADLVVIALDPDPESGFAKCREVKAEQADVPVVFMSNHCSTDDILQGYDAGGQDFIKLPVEKALLAKRLDTTRQQASELKNLRTGYQEVSQMAMSALSNAADIGIILNFVREGVKAPNQQVLVERMTKTIAQYGLSGMAQVRSGGECWNASTSEQLAPMEEQLLERVHMMEQRIIQLESRMIINYDYVTIFVKNQPISNPGREGELRDYLTILAENANDLIQKIRDDLAIAEQRLCLVMDALKDGQKAMGDIQKYQEKYKNDSMQLMNTLVHEIEEEFNRQDLTQEQEAALTEIVQRKLNEALELAESGLNLDQQLGRITSNLDELTRSF